MIKICENQLDKFKRSRKGYYYAKYGIILFFNKNKIYSDVFCTYKPYDNFVEIRAYELITNLIGLGVLEIIDDMKE